MRRWMWRLHGTLGLVAGLGLLLIGLSGSLLVFHEELAAWLSPEKECATPTAAGRLPLDRLLHAAQTQLPDHEIMGWHVRPEGTRYADELYVIRHGDNVWLTATLDPYTGALLSSPYLGTEGLHGWLLQFHSAFFAGDIGVFATGLLAVVLCFLGVSGVWIYRQFWRHLFTFRWGRGLRLWCSDAHKAVGITSTAFNLVLGFTGAYWNLTHTVEHVAGGEVEQTVIPGRLYPAHLSLEALVRDASKRLPGFTTHFISLPSVPNAPAVILWGAVEPRFLLANAYGSTLTYDPQTGEHRATNDVRRADAWRRTTDTFEALHFGNFGGWLVKSIWSLAGLAPGILAITGFVLWRFRRGAARRGLARNRAAVILS